MQLPSQNIVHRCETENAVRRRTKQRKYIFDITLCTSAGATCESLSRTTILLPFDIFAFLVSPHEHL